MNLVLQEDDQFLAKKVPVEKTGDYIDFSNATDEEIKNEIITLFQKQKQLAAFTCQNFTLDPNIRINLMCIIKL